MIVLCRRFLLVILLAGFHLACGGDEKLSLELDADARLLRDDLPIEQPEAHALVSGDAFARRYAGRSLLPAFPTGMTRWSPGTGSESPRSVNRTTVRLGLDPVERTLSGEAEISLLAGVETLDSIRFELSASEVIEVHASQPAAQFEFAGNVLTVTPDVPLEPGQSWDLLVVWRDADTEIQVEFFPEGFAKDVLVGYLGEPSSFFTFGYWLWPRPVDQELISELEFWITYPENLTLVMSGRHVDTTSNGDGTATDTWDFPHPIQWNVSLALADYQKAVGSCGSGSVEVYGMPGQSIDGFDIVPSVYVPVLESVCKHYSALFGEPGFEVIRLVGVDERFTNGYSSPGLILVPNYTLDDDGSGSFPERDFYIAHEFSHQWWGNDVFMAEASDIWLTEGLADYSAISYLDDYWGEEEARRAWLADARMLLSYYQSGGVDHPLVPDGSLNMEPVIYYMKGAWVFRMLEWVIGEDALKSALRSYREAHSFAMATTQDFVDAAEDAYGQDLSWFFEQWLYGTGVMSLAGSHKRVGGVVEVTVSQGTTWSEGQFFRMPVGVRVEKGGRVVEDFVWLEGEETTVVIEGP